MLAFLFLFVQRNKKNILIENLSFSYLSSSHANLLGSISKLDRSNWYFRIQTENLLWDLGKILDESLAAAPKPVLGLKITAETETSS